MPYILYRSDIGDCWSLLQDLDLENNKEFQKLRFAAPGPKMIESKQIKQEPGTLFLTIPGIFGYKIT